MTKSAQAPASRRRRWRAYLPPQHGAWAMLAVPFLVGGVDRLQVPLFVAWIAGYLLSYYAFQTLRVRRRRSRYA